MATHRPTIRNVSKDFDTKQTLNQSTYFLYDMGVPIGAYPSYEAASAEEGRQIIKRLKLKPAKGGMWKHWRSHLRQVVAQAA